MNTSTPAVRLVSRVALVLALVPLLVTSCTKGSSAPTKGPDQTYQVRGEIARLPEGGSGVPEIWIRHEAIPTFTTEDGQKVGMDSMTMPFGLAQGVPTDGLAVGDKVAFALEVRWSDRAAPARVVRLEKLAAETELTFGPPGK